MAYFKSYQNSWPRYGIKIFMVRFKLCTHGVWLKMRVSFLQFLLLVLFLRSLGIYFLRSDFEAISRVSILRSKVFSFQPVIFKAPKITKHTKSYLHQTRGQMDYFKEYQTSLPRYGKVRFLWCVLKYV